MQKFSRASVLCIGTALIALLVPLPAQIDASPAPAPAPAPDFAAAAEPDFEYVVREKVEQGLQVVRFYTPYGEITLNLPMEIMGGETVTGTIELRHGRQSRAGSDFERYFIAIDGTPVPATAGTVVWNVPVAAPGAAGYVELLSARGETLESTGVEICQIEPRPDGPVVLENPVLEGGMEALPFRDRFVLPEFAQRGRLLEISGEFDGDFSTTDVVVDGVVAEKVAESSHVVIVRNPATALGPREIYLREGSEERRGGFSNFDFTLGTNPHKLSVGDSIRVQLTAEGLFGVTRPIPVVATNLTPEVVMLRGVDPCAFHFNIQPSEIGLDGRASFDIEADVVGEGTFTMVTHFTITAIKHVKNVSFPPHVTDFSFHPGPHLKDTTWEPHVTGVSFSPRGHKSGVTWQSHVADVTFSNQGHKSGVTWIEHVESVSFPPKHISGSSWEPHQAGVSFNPPNHTSGITTKPHLSGYTYNSDGHKSGQTWAPHSSGVTFPPPPAHTSGVSWKPHTSGVSWPP